jgi:hypothetical protein
MSRTHFVRAAVIVVSVPAICLLFLPGCSNNNDPFSYMKVHGTVSYDDGALIPAERLMVSFEPQTTKAAGNLHPRVANSLVDVTTGKFSYVTSHTPGDGLVRGEHKVIVTSSDGRPLPPKIVPAEYASFEKTPLRVDTAHLPFEIKVPKPSAGSGGGARR